VKLLALDTSTELCSAAVWLDGALITREASRERGHSELILPMIEQLLQEADVPLSELDAIAFGCGPGAFTGVRLALAVAQGLGLAAGLPLLPISDLRALALRALGATNAPARALICQDARMGEVYWACFERSGEQVPAALEAVSAPDAVRLPPQWLGSPVCGAGSGFEAYEGLSSRVEITPIWGQLRPRALEVARLAALDGLAAAVAPDAAEPVYLRNDVATPQS